ncbi:hypothetical protein MIR68_009112 [Amoeboaphelidium protococcarum]|nr:hypothetical protein MIR68_009112 [Amoeboaphelidium protococcarum]
MIVADLFKQSIAQFSTQSGPQNQAVQPLSIAVASSSLQQSVDDISKTSQNLKATKALQQTINKDDEEKMERTMFLGNLPLEVMDKAGTRELKQFILSGGCMNQDSNVSSPSPVESQQQLKIDSIRFRSIALSRPTKNKKMRKVAITKHVDLHEQCDTVNAYVVFKERQMVKQCIDQLNGKLFQDRHLRCDYADHKKPFDPKHTIFVGNLPLNASEEALWRQFENACGHVHGVRVVRDNVTNVGKGIAYVCFKDKSSVSIALQMNETPYIHQAASSDHKAQTRPMRISQCVRKVKDSKKRQPKESKDSKSNYKRRKVLKANNTKQRSKK